MATLVSWNCETENEKIKSLVIQKKKRLGCSSVLLLNTRGQWWPTPSTKPIRAAVAKTVPHFLCSFLVLAQRRRRNEFHFSHLPDSVFTDARGPLKTNRKYALRHTCINIHTKTLCCYFSTSWLCYLPINSSHWHFVIYTRRRVKLKQNQLQLAAKRQQGIFILSKHLPHSLKKTKKKLWQLQKYKRHVCGSTLSSYITH